METLHDCCAGLDVHKKTVVACVRRVGPDGAVSSQVRTFGTMTADLQALSDWLAAQGVHHVAMGSTGVSWGPVFNLPGGTFEALPVDARRLKDLPGRETDVKDAEWITQLLRYGRLSPSSIPPPEIRRLRDLTRPRTRLIRDRATVADRIQRVLEGADIKPGDVAGDVPGASGRALIRALIAGEDDPGRLAELAKRRSRAKIPALQQALHGRVAEHHRSLLRASLDQIGSLEGLIARFDAQIEEAMAPFAAVADRLRGIPGVGPQAAEVIVAELGTAMAPFPTAGHLASWAGLCPGNDESAGERRSGKTTKGSQWLRTTSVQAAWAASHTKKTIFSACYHVWAKRLGRKGALVAVAHKMLVVIDCLLRNHADYRERRAPPKVA
jgi:transposase